jgi:hypothetical protein
MAMFSSGLAVAIVSWLLWIVFAYSRGFNFAILLPGLALATIAIMFGRRFPEGIGRVTVSTLIPYVLIHGYLLYGVVSSTLDPQYDGVFWYSEFFLLPAMLYASPIALCALGAWTGSRRSYKSAGILGLTLLVTCIAIASIGLEGTITHTSTFTYDLVDDENAHLNVNVKCEYTPKKNYWAFMDLTRGECSETKVAVASKRPGLRLSTEAVWTYDGQKEHVPIYPINQSTHSVAIDCFKPGYCLDSPHWSMWFSHAKIAHAKQVSFRWGELQVDFGDEQFESMRLFRENVEHLMAE